MVVGGWWWWINPLQTLSQGLVLTLRSLLALSLTIIIIHFLVSSICHTFSPGQVVLPVLQLSSSGGDGDDALLPHQPHLVSSPRILVAVNHQTFIQLTKNIRIYLSKSVGW